MVNGTYGTKSRGYMCVSASEVSFDDCRCTPSTVLYVLYEVLAKGTVYIETEKVR